MELQEAPVKCQEDGALQEAPVRRMELQERNFSQCFSIYGGRRSNKRIRGAEKRNL